MSIIIIIIGRRWATAQRVSNYHFQASNPSPGGCTTTHRSADRCDQQVAGRKIAWSRMYCDPRLCVSQTLEHLSMRLWVHLATNANSVGSAAGGDVVTSKSCCTEPMEYVPSAQAKTTASPTEARLISDRRARLLSLKPTLSAQTLETPNVSRRSVSICLLGVLVGDNNDACKSNSSSAIEYKRSQLTSRRTLLSQLPLLLGAECENKWLPYFFNYFVFPFKAPSSREWAVSVDQVGEVN